MGASKRGAAGSEARLAKASDPLELATVRLEAPTGETVGVGTVVGARAILTCAHVVEGLREVKAHASQSKPPVTFTVDPDYLGDLDSRFDLALLRTEEPMEGVEPMFFGTPEREQTFAAIGYPENREGEPEKSEAYGRVGGPSDFWSWLSVDTRGTQSVVEKFSGGACWVKREGYAVGLVAYYGKGGLAYVIPTEMIESFWPDLPVWGKVQSPVEGETEKANPLPRALPRCIPNKGAVRFVTLKTGDGRHYGQGLRLSRDWVLGARRSDFPDPGRVVDRDSFTLRETICDVAFPELGDGQGGSFLVLRSPFHIFSHSALRPDYETPVPGCPWMALVVDPQEGYRNRQLVRGRLGPTVKAGDRYRLELDGTDWTEKDLILMDSENVSNWTGAGVFLCPEGEKDWKLAGMLAPVLEEGSVRLEMTTLGPLENTEVDRELVRNRTPSGINRVKLRNLGKRWERRGLLKALADQDEKWALLYDQEGSERLAETLVSATPPQVLASRMTRVHFRLLEEGSSEARRLSKGVLGMLMTALPFALHEHWGLELPEASAVDVDLALVDPLLVELALATVEGGPARFEDEPAQQGEDRKALPRALHSLPFVPSELGPSPDGKAEACEFAREAAQRLAFDVSMDAATQTQAIDFVTKTAFEELVPGEAPLIPRGMRAAAAKEARERTAGGSSTSLLDSMDKLIGKPTIRDRYLYLHVPDDAQERERKIVEAIRQLLPSLKVVESRVGDETRFLELYQSLEQLLKQHETAQKSATARATEPADPEKKS